MEMNTSFFQNENTSNLFSAMYFSVRSRKVVFVFAIRIGFTIKTHVKLIIVKAAEQQLLLR